MTRIARSLALALIFFIYATVALAQSADKIIDRHLKAIGGTKQIRQLQSTVWTGTISNPATGQSGRFALRLKRPDRYATEMDLSGFEVSAAYNGRSAWRRDSRDGLRTLTGTEGNRFKAEALYRNDRLLNYKREKIRAVVVGQPVINERPAYAVELTTRQGLKRKVYFDAQTYLILREEQETAAAPEIINYGDYRKVDGVLEPFALELRQGDSLLQVVINQVEHNRPLAEAAFDYPKISDAPLPDIPTLLRQVGQNQQRIDELIENYTYTRTATGREVNEKGRVIEKDSHTWEVSHYLGSRLTRLVKKNGQSLSPEETDKETKRLEKRIREIEEQKKKDEERQRKREAARARGEQVKEDDDEADLSAFLRICDFVNPRRERFRGQEVIVFDFQPKPGIKPRNRGESIIQKLVGVMWVDEKEKEIARLEARLNDKFKIGGGLLASLQAGSAMVFEQEMVNQEVWLPSYAEVNFSARFLLFMGVNINQTIRYSDYKKFKSEQTGSEIKDPIKP